MGGWSIVVWRAGGVDEGWARGESENSLGDGLLKSMFGTGNIVYVGGWWQKRWWWWWRHVGGA